MLPCLGDWVAIGHTVVYYAIYVTNISLSKFGSFFAKVILSKLLTLSEILFCQTHTMSHQPDLLRRYCLINFTILCFVYHCGMLSCLKDCKFQKAIYMEWIFIPASKYQLRISRDFRTMQYNFSSCDLVRQEMVVNGGVLSSPKSAGTPEEFTIRVPTRGKKNHFILEHFKCCVLIWNDIQRSHFVFCAHGMV